MSLTCSLACRSALLDGEIVVEDTSGVSVFDSLPSAMKHQPHRLVLYAFDLLHLDGQDLRQQDLVERRSMLSEIIKPDFAIRYSEHFDGDGVVFFAATVQHGLRALSPSARRAAIAAGRQRLGSRQRTWSRANSCCSGLNGIRRTAMGFAMPASKRCCLRRFRGNVSAAGARWQPPLALDGCQAGGGAPVALLSAMRAAPIRRRSLVRLIGSYG
jgi:ATP dependent DNA ligase domain